MPIHVAQRDEFGWYDTQVICDECGAAIQNAEDGYVEWRPTGRGADLHFTHKLCRSRFETSRRGRWSADELVNLPIRLAAALRLPIEVVPEEGPSVGYVLRGRLTSGEL